MFQVGSLVRVLAPFAEFYPDVYEVAAVNGTVATLANGVDFDFVYLTAA